MSPDKLRKRKLKERSRVDREINVIKLKIQEKKKKTKLDLNKKRKKDKENGVGSDYPPSLEDDYRVVEKNHEIFNGECGESTEKKKKKKKKKSMLVLNTKNRKKTVEVDSNNDDWVHAEENADDGMMYRNKVEEEKMSPDKLRKRKLKVRRVDREINELKSQEKKKKTKLDLNKKRKKDKENGVGSDYPPSLEDDYRVVEKNHEIFNGERGESTEKKKKKKKKKSMLVLNTKNGKKTVEVDSNNDDRVYAEENADDGMMYPDDRAKILTISQTLSATSEEPKESNTGTKIKTKKRKREKHKRKETHISTGRIKEETPGGVDEPKVDEISSVDEDCSRGMKKWLIKYKESRPGLNILQQRIDDYITAYEEQQEEERKEREARAAEGGWTVVVHHKGRKKTTDTESGVTVGSVAQEAVVDKMSKKKSKEIPLDFYRFHKREAQRNEVMMLQSKFEQDKKRIQQLRAARKFRPY